MEKLQVMPVLLLILLIMVIVTRLIKKKEGQTGNNSTKYVEIVVSLKYLSNFWRTFEMLDLQTVQTIAYHTAGD